MAGNGGTRRNRCGENIEEDEARESGREVREIEEIEKGEGTMREEMEVE